MKLLSQFLLLSSLVLGLSACHPKSVNEKTHYGVNAMGTRKAQKVLLKEAEKTTWLFVKNFDPYNGGITTLADPQNPVSIEMYADGTFTETEGSNRNKGKWLIGKKTRKLTLIYTQQGDFSIPEQSQKVNLEFQIRKNTEDSLCLAIQGRHGFVEKHYIKKK